ncbi:MAG: hypothetical protein CL760_05205 [Chloroflexi bacterium]|nr:hypothetical protein [Chloroflexota bacterium]|tara:strand:- start:13572 stop:14177 length:606 start_codon:yes stop_codon:yes gene_type:complete
MLKLTFRELENIINGNLLTDRFEVLFNAIPNSDYFEEECNPNDYLEDDGRELRHAAFKDHLTGITHSFNYVYHPEYGSLDRYSMMDKPNDIEIVSVSVLEEPKPKKKETEPELSPQQVRTKSMFSTLNAMKDRGELVKFDITKTSIPKTTIKADVKFYKDMVGGKIKASILDVRERLLPTVIDHKTEINTYWNFLQTKPKI